MERPLGTSKDRRKRGDRWHRNNKTRVVLGLALLLLTVTAVSTTLHREASGQWIFDGSETTHFSATDTAPVELGLKFIPKVSGTVSAVRFYKPAQSSGPYEARLWDDRGQTIAQVSFPAGTSEGWRTAILSPSVAVTAGRQYTASYSAPSGRYAATERYFATETETEHLRIPTAAGVYEYGLGGYPTSSYRESNYYIDIKFTPKVPPTPPSEVSQTPTASPTMAPTGAPETGVLNLPMEPWHGGPRYYSKFSKAVAAGWIDPTFFPIAVFFGKPGHAAALKSIGVNTYMGAEHDGSAISTITREGISVLAQDEWTSAEVGADPRVVGWHISDECDMGLSGCDQGNGQYGSVDVQRQYTSERRALNDGRFIQANFGNGVLGSHWSPNTMDDHIALVDVSSVDKYAYTSTHVQELFTQSPHWPTGKNPAAATAYGWQQDRMETFSAPIASKPNWVFVETAKPFLTEAEATTITGDQIEGAVWNSIIHGASGVAYFQHNNNGQCGTYSLVECSQTLKSRVAQVNSSVKSLAPVLNTPSYVWSFGPGLDTALKTHAGSAYIIAMTDGDTGSRTLTIPPGIRGTQVEVVGESRTLTATNGRFTDSFAAENDHHIYRIAVG